MSDSKKLLLTGLAIASGLIGIFGAHFWLYERFHESWIVMVIFMAIWNVANWFFWRRVDRNWNWKSDPDEPDESERPITLFPRK